MTTGVNQWAGVVRASDRQLMAVSPSAGAGAWAGQAAKVFTFNTPYTAIEDTLLFGALMVQATTPPQLLGNPSGVTLALSSPVISGTSNTGQTTPLTVGTILTAFTAVATIPYCYAS